MPISRRLTLDEFLALPDEEPALELEPDGIVVQKVSALGQHSRLQFALCERINRFAESRRLALAFPELRVVFGGAAYVPDVCVFGWDRIPCTIDGEVANRFDAPPDVAIDIVSPEQSTNAQLRRCLFYVDKGVELALLVDSADRSIVRFEQAQSPIVLRNDQQIQFGAKLAGFAMTVRELFDSLRLEP